MSHETDSGIAGLFFNIYSFKLAKDQINTLTVKKKNLTHNWVGLQSLEE